MVASRTVIDDDPAEVVQALALATNFWCADGDLDNPTLAGLLDEATAECPAMRTRLVGLLVVTNRILEECADPASAIARAGLRLAAG